MVDTRLLIKPTRFKDGNKDPSAWAEWRFTFENYMACLDEQYSDELTQAADQANPIIISASAQPATHKRAKTLFAVLAGLLTGKDLALCKPEKVPRNGFEVWRRVVQEHEPKSDSRKL